MINTYIYDKYVHTTYITWRRGGLRTTPYPWAVEDPTWLRWEKRKSLVRISLFCILNLTLCLSSNVFQPKICEISNLFCELFGTRYQSVTSRSREFPFPAILQFFWWYWNRNRKFLVPKKVSEPVSKKIGTEKSLGTGIKNWYQKKSRNRSQNNLVPKKVS